MERDRCAALAGALRPPRQQHQQQGRDPGPPAVDEVDEIGIGRQRRPERASPADAFGHQMIVHERPAVGHIACVQPCGEGAEHQLNQQRQQHGQCEGSQSRRARAGVAGQRAQVERGPDQPAHDEQRRQQMHRQAIMADVGALRQAGFDHPPADRALQSAQREQGRQPPAIAFRDRPLPGEPQQRQREGDADQSPEQPVHPLPEKDELELGQAHAPVDLPIFRNLLVQAERLHPLVMRQRRDGAADRLPLGNRQPRFGQARDAADHHHAEDERRHDEQPASDGAWRRAVGHDRHRRSMRLPPVIFKGEPWTKGPECPGRGSPRAS